MRLSNDEIMSLRKVIGIMYPERNKPASDECDCPGCQLARMGAVLTVGGKTQSVHDKSDIELERERAVKECDMLIQSLHTIITDLNDGEMFSIDAHIAVEREVVKLHVNIDKMINKTGKIDV